MIGLAITVVLLWWTLRDVHLAEVAGHIASVRWVPFAAMIAASTLRFPLVTWRWRYLLRLDGATLPFTPLWHATAVGFMANNVLPARAGEVARAFTANRLTGAKFTTVAGTIIVERVMDGLTLVALLTVGIALSGFTASTTVGGVALGRIMVGVMSIFVIILIVAVAVVHRPEVAMKLFGRLAERMLPKKFVPKALGVAHGLLDGLDVLRSWRRFTIVFAWSLVVWGVNGLSFWFCFLAFGIDVPAGATWVLQSLIGFGVAIPSSPGFFGPFEAVTKATLAAYGVGVDVAVSYAVGYHLTTFVPITVLGMISLSRARLHLGDLSANRHAGAAAAQ